MVAEESLGHLEHYHVEHLHEALPLISYAWTVFHFPAHKNTKPAMYGRMWEVRKTGIDCMVRQLNDEYVLIARKEVFTYGVLR